MVIPILLHPFLTYDSPFSRLKSLLGGLAWSVDSGGRKCELGGAAAKGQQRTLERAGGRVGLLGDYYTWLVGLGIATDITNY